MEYKFTAKHERIDFARIAKENEGVKVLVVEWKNRHGQTVAVRMYSDEFLARCARVGVCPPYESGISINVDGNPTNRHAKKIDGWKFGPNCDSENVRRNLDKLLQRLIEAEKAVEVTVSMVVI